MSKSIDKLILNNPYLEPKKYWLFDRELKSFEKKNGRRVSGYWKHSTQTVDSNDPGEFVEINLVNRIRPRVTEWRNKNYPNITPTTKRLIEFWKNSKEREQNQKAFFCQFEAVETAIWLTESLDSEKQGIKIPKDGELIRECFKLATGTGKTVVMSMLIAWQVLNKIESPKDPRYSKNILIITPGITVKERLAVLLPSNEENFYKEFRILDDEMWKHLYQAKIVLTNWHNLAEKSDSNKKGVLKRGVESDVAFCSRVLKEFSNAKNILVINDEAHHCHRSKEKNEEKSTIWISGLDKINNARNINKIYDLSATPFRPSGLGGQDEKLFPWIVSDFGLNDAIESGLVKTPKIAIKDDANLDDDLKSKYFNIYSHVKDDLNRKVDEKIGLPDLVKTAVDHLGTDWLEKKLEWKKSHRPTPPVFICVSNIKETAARLKFHLIAGYSSIHELSDENKLLRIDQEALEKLESSEEGTKDQLQKDERLKFNTVGKTGKEGENIHCVIGVNMLSEGWDCRTVTNILGLRAFTSQLLCEQVIGRGLRRISYELNEEGLFDPEYVTVFGIPFTFLPFEGDEGGPKPPEKPKTLIQPVESRKKLEICFPNVLRINKKINSFIEFDIDDVDPLEIELKDCPLVVEIAPTIDNQPKFDLIETIKLDKLAEKNRLATTIFQASIRAHESFGKSWKGDVASHLSQLQRIFEKFINSEKLKINLPPNDNKDKMKKIVLSQKIQTITEHIRRFIIQRSSSEMFAILDEYFPILKTGNMKPWLTVKKSQPIINSHINNVVVDSKLEALIAQELERMSKKIISWVKNDHLGFKIWYTYKGEIRTYFPDFIIKINNEKYIIIEVKGKKEEEAEYKWNSAKEWCDAVSNLNKFGEWKFFTVFELNGLKKIFD